MILRLSKLGLLSTADKAKTYLQGFPSEVTITELLQHQSGIVGLIDIINWRQLKAQASQIPLRDWVLQRSKTFKYANFNYLLLARIIEERTGLSYNEALDRYLLKPYELGVAYTGSSSGPKGIINSVIGPLDPTHHTFLKYPYLWSFAGDGGVVANVLTVAKLLATVTTNEDFAAMRSFNYFKYSMGLYMQKVANTELELWGHNGALLLAGIYANAFRDQKGRKIILLSNVDYNEAQEKMYFDLWRLAEGKKLTAATAAEWSSYSYVSVVTLIRPDCMLAIILWVFALKRSLKLSFKGFTRMLELIALPLFLGLIFQDIIGYLATVFSLILLGLLLWINREYLTIAKPLSKRSLRLYYSVTSYLVAAILVGILFYY